MEHFKLCYDLEESFIEPTSRECTPVSNLSDDVKTLCTCMQTLDYNKVVKLNCFDEINIGKLADSSFLVERILKFLDGGDQSEYRLFQIFCFGVSNLQLFVQSNWLGYSIEGIQEDSPSIIEELTLDGECIYPTIKNLTQLYLAKIILFDLKDRFSNFKLFDWWLLRYLFVHQQILEEPSRLLNNYLVNVFKEEKLEENLKESKQLKSLLQTELGYCYLLYGDTLNVKQHFEKAHKEVDFEMAWEGALGKRTFYQEKALPQLTVKVRHGLSTTVSESYENREFTKDLKLDDDTRLNKIAFVNQDENLMPNLCPLGQALLLTQAAQILRCHAKDEFINEELSPLLNCILDHPKVWSLHYSALITRSKLESNHARSIGRSMTQFQELVDSLAKNTPPAQQRLEFFYVSRVPLKWEVSSMLADVLHSMGAVNSALDIYIRIQMWENVISCFQQLEMKHRAEEIVRQELEKKETPKLLCLLGDCTDDVQFYEKAWELSKHSSARAQRDWALYYYRRKQYAKCIPHFEKSVEVNSLHEGTWARLAFAAMEIEDWETAARAYRRYCSLNMDSFEGWNNVAKCYIKLGQKVRAFKALLEAVKQQYDNWKLWDNLMVVSVDCSAYEEVLRSYNRILDLKEKHVDLQVLRILVQAVVEDKEDCFNTPVRRFSANISKLLGRLTSQVTNNAEIWEIYADLIHAVEEGPSGDYRVAQTLQKAYRSAAQESGWEKDLTSCNSTLNISLKFVDSCLALLTGEVSKDHTLLASSAKLSIRSIISTIKRCYGEQVPAGVDEQVATLDSKLNILIDTLSKTPM